MSFRVVITAQAAGEVDRAFNWLAERSPVAAEKWRGRMLDAIDSLKVFPARCGLAPEDEWYDGELRQLLFGKRRGIYRVLFEIRGREVVILRVRHGARAFLDLGDL